MAERYTIELQGELNIDWATWLGDFEMTYSGAGQTILTGDVIDQSALHGLLARIRDLGIPILLVARLDVSTSNRNNQTE